MPSSDSAAPIAYPTDLDSDIVKVSPPCVVTASEEVWCWESSTGSHALTRIDLPPSTGVLPIHLGVCGWTSKGAVCVGDSPDPLTGGLGLSDVWWDEESVVFPDGYRPTRHVRVRPDATEVVRTPCPDWDFGLVWRVGDRLETDCLTADVSSLADTVSLAGGGDHVCGVHADGGVSCLLLMPNRGAPMSAEGDGRVPGLTDVVELALGGGIGCARHSTGRVSCFGYSSRIEHFFGEVRTHRGRVQPPFDIGVEGATALAMNYDQICIAQGPRVQCHLPFTGNGQPADMPIYGLPPVSFASRAWDRGAGGGCATARSGDVWCWDPTSAYRPQKTELRPVALAGHMALTAEGDLYRYHKGQWTLHTRSVWPEPPKGVTLSASTGRACAEVSGQEPRCVTAVSHTAAISRATDGGERVDKQGRAYSPTRSESSGTVLSGVGIWSYLEVDGGTQSGARPIPRRTPPPPLPTVPWPEVGSGTALVRSEGDFAFDEEGWAYREVGGAPHLVPEGFKPADPAMARHCPLQATLRDCERRYAQVGGPLRWTRWGALTPSGELIWLDLHNGELTLKRESGDFSRVKQVVKSTMGAPPFLLHQDGRVSAGKGAKGYAVDSFGPATEIATADRTLCALVDERVWCVGQDLPLWDTGIDQAVQLVGSGKAICARQRTGRVQCIEGPLQWYSPSRPGDPSTGVVRTGVSDQGLEDVVSFDAQWPNTFRAVRADGTLWVRDGARHLAPLRQLLRVKDVVTNSVSALRGGGCALASDRSVWCWTTDALVETGTKAGALSPGQSPMWLSDEGHVEAWEDGIAARVVDDLWPSPPDGVRVGELAGAICAFVPGGEVRCVGEKILPPGPISDWTRDRVLHGSKGVLTRDGGALKPVTFLNEKGGSIQPPKKIRLLGRGVLGDGVLYTCSFDGTCRRVLPEREFVDARGRLVLDASGVAYDVGGRVVFEGAQALGGGSMSLIDREGTAWAVGVPGYEGWRQLAVREQ
ncbi:MAG: hypothetical protein EA397_19775 [Deltaproteobacteria bacterium]|nr:MAG: hypothetical protein EA397_19775 [Deltaproteobacteria bacterium]